MIERGLWEVRECFGREVFEVCWLFGEGEVAGGFDEGGELVVGDFGLVHEEAVHFDAADGGFFGESFYAVGGLEAPGGAHFGDSAGNFRHPFDHFDGGRGCGFRLFARDENCAGGYEYCEKGFGHVINYRAKRYVPS